MKSLQDTYRMKNSVEIPCIGFGTWQIDDPKAAYDAVSEAIKVGYRHIDTAAVYGNEESVGKAVRESGVKREEIFVTSKLWNGAHGYDAALKAFDETMDKLGFDYLDLYLIHWPIPKVNRDDWQEANKETWRAFTRLYEENAVRSIGVSNFLEHHIEAMVGGNDLMPMVNQIELHPGFTQNDIVSYCKKNDIIVEAWGPMATGGVFSVPDIELIAHKYDKSVAQVCLRWSIQKGFLPLPKSVTPFRMKENADIFDFNISDIDMDILDDLHVNGSGIDPDNINF